MIKISCPHCGQGYDCDDEFNGETITCQKCSKEFEISNQKPVHTQESKEQQKNIEQQPQQSIQEQNFQQNVRSVFRKYHSARKDAVIVAHG